MRKANFLRTALAATLAVAGLSIASLPAETAYTVPQGYLNQTITALKTTAISFPLYGEPVVAGSLTSVGASTLADSSASFSAIYDDAATPHYIRITSGAGVGRFFKIATITATDATVDLGVTGVAVNDAGAAVAVGDKYEIFPGETLNTLFGSGTGTLLAGWLTGTSATTADNVQIWNPSGSSWNSYFNTGATWKKGLTSNLGNTVIPPDSAVYVVRRGVTDLVLTNIGSCSPTNMRTSILSGPSKKTYMAFGFPADKTLASAGFQSITGWTSASSATAADNVQIWNTSAASWSTYYYTGTAWKKGLSTVDANTVALPAGTPIMLNIKGTLSGSNQLYTSAKPAGY